MRPEIASEVAERLVALIARTEAEPERFRSYGKTKAAWTQALAETMTLKFAAQEYLHALMIGRVHERAREAARRLDAYECAGLAFRNDHLFERALAD